MTAGLRTRLTLRDSREWNAETDGDLSVRISVLDAEPVGSRMNAKHLPASGSTRGSLSQIAAHRSTVRRSTASALSSPVSRL
jgi:hypothetical protein